MSNFTEKTITADQAERYQESQGATDAADLANHGIDPGDDSYFGDPVVNAHHATRGERDAAERHAPPAFPAPMAEAAFHGIAGRAVRIISPHTEAAPEALLLRLLSAVGCVAGRGPHFTVGGTRHPALIYPVFVGPTKTGCKGQSYNDVMRLLSLAFPDFAKGNIGSGLSTGQGLAHAVRDPLRGKPTSKAERDESAESEDGMCLLDAGVADKRLLVYEAELVDMLAAGGRESNNLTGAIRLCWDGRTLRQMVRKDPYTATDPHVTIQADVTPEELVGRLAKGDRTNGFANRFIYVASRRARSLSRGGSLTLDALEDVAGQLAEALAPFAIDEETGHTPDKRYGFTPAAGRQWDAMYESMNDDPGPPLGPLLARRVPQTRRIAMIYALLDGAGDIDVEHLDAAVAVWDYCERSTAWAFGGASAGADPLDILHRWALDRNDPPTAAEAARSGPKPYRGNRDGADAGFHALADAGRGTYAYVGIGPAQAKRFTPSEGLAEVRAGGYGYASPPYAPETAACVSVSTAEEAMPSGEASPAAKPQRVVI